jgi:hypothetical protein
MRCYFIRDGHIAAVKVFPEGTSDEVAVEEGRKLYDQIKDEHKYEGFEVWKEARHVYRWPPVKPG